MWAAMIPAIAQTAQAAIRGDTATANGMPGGGSLGMGSGLGGVFSSIDSSGWTVATSGSKASATTGDRGGQSAVPPSAFAQAAGLGSPIAAGGIDTGTALLMVGALVAVVILTRRK